MSLWRRIVLLFSQPAAIQQLSDESTDSSRRQSVDDSPNFVPAVPPTSNSSTISENIESPQQDTDSHIANSDHNNDVTHSPSDSEQKPQPRAKQKSIGRNSGISEKTIKQLKEKYKTDASPTHSSSERASTAFDGESPPRRPKKKSKGSSSRSTRKSGSLRKAVLMQEEARHVMTLDDVRVPDEEGNTPLHRVALLGNYEAVSLLCKRAPDIVNRLNKNGMSALHYASNSNCVNVLVWWGAGIDIKSSSGKTPLYCAVERGNSPDAVEALLQRGAKVNQKSRDEGWVPLHVAAMRGLVQTVELLLEWNANVGAKDKRHATPLHLCAGVKSRESEEICRKLIHKRAKVASRDINGATPMHMACSSGNTSVLTLILEKMSKKMPGAFDLVDNKGCTAYHYASMGGHTECIDILKRELPICESWLDDLGLSYSSWALTRGHFVSDFYPSGMVPFCADFMSCVNDESTSDVIFVAEGLPVFAHKIFCYTSPYLAKLIDAVSLPNDLAANAESKRVSHIPQVGPKPTIDIKGIIPHKVFLETLQFMYTGKVPKDSDWNQLWFSSIKLDLIRLQQLCEKELGGNPLRERSLSAVNKRNSNPIADPPSPLSSSAPAGNPFDTAFSITSLNNPSNNQTIASNSSSTNTNHASNRDTSNSDPNNCANITDSNTSNLTSNTSNTNSITQPNPSSNTELNTINENLATNIENMPPTTDTLPTHNPGPLRRRTTSRKRSNSSASRLQAGVDPQIDYIHGLSLALRRFVGNPMFHDLLFVCAEEPVFAHKIIVKKRSPNFFFALAKSVVAETAGLGSAETIFHFDNITKAAMVSLMEYIYCGAFHSKLEPEDSWVMYNFVVKHGIICPGLKERASHLFYNSLSPENLLDLFALNRYGFTITTLPYNPADSARYAAAYSAKDKEGSGPSASSSFSSWSNMGSMGPTPTTAPITSVSTVPSTVPSTSPTPTTSSTDPNTNPNVPSASTLITPNLIPNTYTTPTPANNPTATDNYRASISLPNSINRQSVNYRNSITINHLPGPSSSFNSANQEILQVMLKYASKKVVSKYITKHNKKNPTVKLLQSELRKSKAEPDLDSSKLWKDRRKEVKAFAKRKKLQSTDTLQRHSISESGRRN